jgi:hypothetical protein
MKLLSIAIMLTATAALAVPAIAQSDNSGARNTPPNWAYEVRDGRRVPRVPRTMNPDGSWTEQVRQGNCTITRTGRDGEVREVRKCD